jgi:uncharacterized membrane protein YeaQ/YmgE (transglycosylase-associated protein family)
MVNHYDWKNQKQTCPACQWTGLGSDTEVGETFGEGAEYHCPTCGHGFGYIAYPLLSESLSDPRAPEADRVFAEIVTRREPQHDATTATKGLAHSYLRKLLIWLFLSFIGSGMAGWISAWAGERDGWEGQFVQFVFGLAGALSFFTFLMFLRPSLQLAQ